MGDVVAVRRIEARLEDRPWPWAEANRAAILDDFERRRRERPKLFNGRVFMVAEHAFRGEVLEAVFTEVDYAALLAWIRWGAPDRSFANGFAMGALRSRDGVYLLGLMAPHTATAGQAYFPAGTPDRSDLRPDGRVDLAGSILRELAEETGFTEGEVEVGEGWEVAREGGLLGFFRRVTLKLTAAEAERSLAAHLAAEPQPELAGLVRVRSPADIDGRMPPYLVTYLRHAFGGEGQALGPEAE